MRHNVVAHRDGETDVSLGRWNDATGRPMPGKALRCVQAIRSADQATFDVRVLDCTPPARTALTTLYAAGVRDFDQINAATNARSAGPPVVPKGTLWTLWERRNFNKDKGRKPERRLSVKPQPSTSRTKWDWELIRRGQTDLSGTVDVSDIAAPRRPSAAMKRAKVAAAAAS